MEKRRWKITLNSPVVLCFVVLSFIATLLGILTMDRSTEAFFMTYHSSLTNPLTYIRFFTHVLGHRGWEHFLGNMTYLLLLGPMLEEKYGSRTMAGIIALTALVTGLVNYIFFPGVGLCGASGVVFAFIILASFTGFREGEIPLTFLLVMTIFIGQQVYEGIAVQDNISNMAHIVGGLVGAVVGYGLNKR
jgi:GlpG protein